MLICLIFLINFVFHNTVANPVCPFGATLSNIESQLCFYYERTARTFYDAENDCFVKGGHLAPIFNFIANLEIALEANERFKNYTDYWIGGNTTNVNSALIWVWTWQNSLIKYNDWAFGQPSGNNGCTSVSLSTASWSSSDCDLLKPYVCQIPAIGYFCENGWTFLDETKMCYKMFANQTLNSTAANDFCQNQNANLVSIHSDAENTLVGKLTTLGSPQNWQVVGVYIGLTHNTAWTWTDGTPFDYQAWGPSDPDNIGLSNCTLFYPDGIISNGHKNYYIMQWDSVDCADTVQRTVCKTQAIVVPMF